LCCGDPEGETLRANESNQRTGAIETGRDGITWKTTAKHTLAAKKRHDRRTEKISKRNAGGRKNSRHASKKKKGRGGGTPGENQMATGAKT